MATKKNYYPPQRPRFPWQRVWYPYTLFSSTIVLIVITVEYAYSLRHDMPGVVYLYTPLVIHLTGLLLFGVELLFPIYTWEIKIDNKKYKAGLNDAYLKIMGLRTRIDDGANIITVRSRNPKRIKKVVNQISQSRLPRHHLEVIQIV